MATGGALSRGRSSRGTPVAAALTSEPQRGREATPEEERVLVRHLRDEYRPVFLYGVVNGTHETGLCTRQCADRLQESTHHISDQMPSRLRQTTVENPTVDRSQKIEILRSSLGNSPYVSPPLAAVRVRRAARAAMAMSERYLITANLEDALGTPTALKPNAVRPPGRA
jgi:hypothetical protein